MADETPAPWGSSMTGHATGTREEWRRARIALLDGRRPLRRRHGALEPARRDDDVRLTCAYKRRMGWQFNWVSSPHSDFSFDFGASYTDEQQGNGAEYNFRWDRQATRWLSE